MLGGSALEFFDDRSSQCVTVDADQPRLQSVQFVRLHLQTLVFRDQPLRVRQQLHAVLGQAHGAGLRSILPLTARRGRAIMKHQFLSMREEYEAQGARRETVRRLKDRSMRPVSEGRLWRDVREGRCGRQCAAVCARYCALRQRCFSFCEHEVVPRHSRPDFDRDGCFFRCERKVIGHA